MAISETVKKQIVENYNLPESDIVINYNGVDIEKFHPNNKKAFNDKIRNKHNLLDEDLVLLFVGTGFKRKGLDYVLKVIKNFDNIKLLVVGKGKFNKYKKKAAKYSISNKVIFVGAAKNVEEYYGASDIFVFPTLYEPFGKVITEAMASGLPVITTKVAGAAEIINHKKDGLLLDSGDNLKKLKDYIDYLRNDNNREKISKNARLKAEKYSQKKNHQRVLEIYEKILKNKN